MSAAEISNNFNLLFWIDNSNAANSHKVPARERASVCKNRDQTCYFVIPGVVKVDVVAPYWHLYVMGACLREIM